MLCVGQVRSQDKDSAAVSQTARIRVQMDSTHRADSIKRVELLAELERLKGTSNNQQREALQLRLQKIEQEDSIKKQKQLEQLEALKATATGFPVAPFGDTLLMVYSRLASFSASERAKAISEKIERIYDDYSLTLDTLKVNVLENSAEIVFKDMMVMSVNELEAMWFDRTPESLAREYVTIIEHAIKEEKRENSIINLVLRIGAIILIIAGIFLLIRLINRLFKRFGRRVISLKNKVLKGIKFRGYQFLDSDRELRLALFVLNVGRLLIIAIMLYVTLPLIFSVFPWTRGIAETLIGWVTTPLKRVFGGLIRYLPNLFTILVIGGVTHYVLRFLKFVASEIESGLLTIPGFYHDWAKPTFNIVKFLLIAFSFVIIFPYLPGSDSPIFQGVSVFVGILFSLGSSSAISNVVAGLVITYMRPFKPGDRIRIGEVTGDVVEKSLLVTRVRTIKNELITIPNSAILQGHTINYTNSAQERGLILHSTVTIGYDAPWKQVHELLISAANSTEGVLQEEGRRPFVLQTSLDDFYVSYQLNIFTEQAHRMTGIYSDLHQNIQDRFNEAGVEIMSPHYRARRDGSSIAIPPEYRTTDYQAPPFNVSPGQKGDLDKDNR
jgi:small-conductance mechanosensitive channel